MRAGGLVEPLGTFLFLVENATLEDFYLFWRVFTPNLKMQGRRSKFRQINQKSTAEDPPEFTFYLLINTHFLAKRSLNFVPPYISSRFSQLLKLAENSFQAYQYPSQSAEIWTIRGRPTYQQG